MGRFSWLAVFVAVGGSAWAQSPSPRPEASPSPALRFRAMDRNQDGVVTRDEWTGNDSSFRNHDCDRDGVLSGDELKPGAAPCPGRGRRGPAWPSPSPGSPPPPAARGL